MHTLTHLNAREILDSRGNPTIEVDVVLDGKSQGRAAVPSGASTGSHEALELRDHDQKRYGGKGVLKAVDHVNSELQRALAGNSYDQKTLDDAMIDLDGTANKARLGANAILGVSLAFSHAVAASQNIPLYRYFAELSGNIEAMRLPIPLMNIINGGAHAANSTDIQEFMVIPLGASNFRESLRWGTETFHALKKILAERQFNTNVGDEGGFAPSFASNEIAIEATVEAIERAGYTPGKDIAIGIDAAANGFYDAGHYELRSEFKKLTSLELIDVYKNWTDRFPLISIEDGLMEDDWDGYQRLTATLGGRVQIVGDDLFVTNLKRLDYGIEHKAANAILVKLNQIGTVTETIATITRAKAAGFRAIISHRSGETEDTSIADLAVGTGAGQIKTGSASRGERTAKYNQLLRIEEELGDNAQFAGRSVFGTP